MRIRIVLLALLSLFIAPAFVYAQDEPVMSMAEIDSLFDKGPVKAYFKSVPEGSTLRKYDIVLREIYVGPGLKIVLFTSKEHIVAGMSGSPVYVNGKLLGAVAYGFNVLSFKNLNWGGISPMQLMMEDRASANPRNMARSFFHDGMKFEAIALGNKRISDRLPGRFNPGLSGLENIMAESAFVMTSGGNTSRGVRKTGSVLKAGMPIVVDILQWTDENGEFTKVGAMGTITYVSDKGEVYAFGHPFLGAKNVKYLFRVCDVAGTIYSEAGSFKIPGVCGDALGTVDYDSGYGVYGLTRPDPESYLQKFSLELKKNGQFFHRFDIRIAKTSFTPVLASVVFSLIGNISGAPLPQEFSTTEAEAKIDIANHGSISKKELYSSLKVQVGISQQYMSSYEVAVNDLMSMMYAPVATSGFNFDVVNFHISANFIYGKARKLKLGAFRFPSKVIWGQDPVLDVVLISEDNSVAVEKRIKISVEWDKVERPVYTKDTKELDKESEKKVTGSFRIYGFDFYNSMSPQAEKDRMYPKYSLNKEDYLASFAGQLNVTRRKIYGHIDITEKSGLFDSQIASAKDIVSAGADSNQAGWNQVAGGVKEIFPTLKNAGFFSIIINFPDLPSGFTVEENLSDGLHQFEIVLER